jgi:hypothetical protein
MATPPPAARFDAWAQSHRRPEGRDPRLTAARERRGF